MTALKETRKGKDDINPHMGNCLYLHLSHVYYTRILASDKKNAYQTRSIRKKRSGKNDGFINS